jgi:predicted ester cyclase
MDDDRTASAPPSLADFYRDDIACLNRRAWDDLGRFVAGDVMHNGRPLGLAGYRAMLVKDCEEIPDLSFEIALLACTPPLLPARLRFACSPRARFLGLDVKGRRIAFAENVFYRFDGQKIVAVWSVIDKTAIEAQLSG